MSGQRAVKASAQRAGCPSRVGCGASRGGWPPLQVSCAQEVRQAGLRARAHTRERAIAAQVRLANAQPHAHVPLVEEGARAGACLGHACAAAARAAAAARSFQAEELACGAAAAGRRRGRGYSCFTARFWALSDGGSEYCVGGDGGGGGGARVQRMRGMRPRRLGAPMPCWRAADAGKHPSACAWGARPMRPCVICRPAAARTTCRAHLQAHHTRPVACPIMRLASLAPHVALCGSRLLSVLVVLRLGRAAAAKAGEHEAQPLALVGRAVPLRHAGQTGESGRCRGRSSTWAVAARAARGRLCPEACSRPARACCTRPLPARAARGGRRARALVADAAAHRAVFRQGVILVGLDKQLLATAG